MFKVASKFFQRIGRVSNIGISIFLISVTSVTWLQAANRSLPFKEIIKSPNDHREYAYVELDNGIRGIVFQDDESENAAFSIAVNAGSLENPKEIPGLAHFVEHLLFLGTEEYPEVNYLNKFLAKHDGYNNAYTSSLDTVYFLSVKSQALPEAVKILSRFFVHPLFKKEYVDRELNAVHSEHSKNLRNDGFIFGEVYGDLYNTNHPASFFFTGNRQTLNIPGIREKVIEFYEKYYGAKNLSFSIQGGKEQTIEELKELAEKWLGDIPSRSEVPKERAYLKGELYRPEYKMPLRLEIKSIKKMDSLNFDFAINKNSYDLAEEYFYNPPYGSANYISKMMNCSMPGCLSYQLQNLGWITSMWAGFRFYQKFKTSFGVGFDLTELGKTKQDEITRALLRYIDVVKKAPLEKWRFEEMVTMSKIDFDFEQKKYGPHMANRLASQLNHGVPYEKILTVGLPEKFKPDEIRELLSAIDPMEMIQSYLSQDVVGEINNYWYKTPYTVKSLDLKELKDLKEMKGVKAGSETTVFDFSFPQPNPFIPNYPTFYEEKNVQENPVRVESSDRFELWMKNEISFKEPQLKLNLSFELPELMTAENQNYRDILLSYWGEIIEQEFFYFRDIGSSVSIGKNIRGIKVSMTTYPDNFSKIIPSLEKVLFDLELVESKFETYRQKNLRNYENIEEITPLARIFKTLSYLNESFTLHEDDLRKAALEVDFEGFKQFYKNIFKKSRLTAFVFGNTNLEEISKKDNSISQVLKNLFLQPDRVVGLSEEERVKIDFLLLPSTKDKKWVSIDQNKSEDFAFARQYQGDRTIEGRATFEVLRKIIAEKYFELLRTQKQIGYIVGANVNTQSKNNRFQFYVQSPFIEPDKIAKETDDFLELITEKVMNLKDEELQLITSSLIQSYTEPDQNFGATFAKYSRALTDQDFDFDLEKPVVAALAALTTEQVKAVFQKTFKTPSRQLEFWIIPESKKIAKEWSNSKISILSDQVKFKQTQPRIPYIGYEGVVK